MNATTKRLSEEEESGAIDIFAAYMTPEDVSAEEYEAYQNGCTVLYRDDHDTGRSYYQVVDAQGHGDGSGEWKEV